MKIRNFIALGLVLALGAPVFAKGSGKCDGHAKLLKELKLSKSQDSKFKKLNKSYQKAYKANTTAIKDAKKALAKAWSSNASDSSLKELHEKLISAKGEHYKAKGEHALLVRGLLKDKQAKAFSEKIGEKISSYAKKGRSCKSCKKGKGKKR